MMQGTEKTVATFVLAAFVLVAGSVICLASGQPSAMTGCGDQMNGAAICPFMSMSLPTVAAVSMGREIAVVLTLALFAAIIAAVRATDHQEAVALSRLRFTAEKPPLSFLNSTLQLISQGVLHARVFGH